MKKINIIEEEEDYGDINVEEEDYGNINFEESDEELPIIINEDEFIKQFTINEKINKSPSPPRKIINELDNEDDIVYRDKYGKRITRDQWLLLNQKKKQKEKEPKQELIWGKGLVQIKEKEEKLQEEEKKINQKFQNYDIDKEYDEELKEKLRWNDPINQNIIQQNDIPKCRYNMVPNRFNIEPGYRWDGVIRGNNYEKRWFEARNIEIAKNKQSYLNNISEL